MTHPTVVPEADLRYVGGDPALDLINTVDWTSRGQEAERLTTFDELTRWAEGAGILGARDGSQLRRQATVHPKAAAAAMEYARDVRGTIRDLFLALARSQPSAAALSRFNQQLAEAMTHLEVAPLGRSAGFAWTWPELESDPRALMWPVIWSAARLLTSDEVGNVRVCDGDDCGWMYVDRSRNGLRRWCQMRTCGTREKSRRRRVDRTA